MPWSTTGVLTYFLKPGLKKLGNEVLLEEIDTRCFLLFLLNYVMPTKELYHSLTLLVALNQFHQGQWCLDFGNFNSNV